MAIATPAFAIVRPRVIVKRTGETGLLEDVVAEIADEYGTGFVRLSGGPGSGKSTALAHLAAVYPYSEHFVFLDEPTPEQLESHSSDSFTIAVTPHGDGRNMELVLQPWGIDELIEYLLQEHHDECGSVIARLGKAAGYCWPAELAVVFLSRMAHDPSLVDPIESLIHFAEEQLPKKKQRQLAGEYCFALLSGKGSVIESFFSRYRLRGIPKETRNVLRHEQVQCPFAVRHLLDRIAVSDFTGLHAELPLSLVKSAGRGCAGQPAALRRLSNVLNSPDEKAHAMAATILLAADPTWRPHTRQIPWQFAGGTFRNAEWHELKLWKANLNGCDFSGANLSGSFLDEATLDKANFENANLSDAMLRVVAQYAQFQRANLTDAYLTGAKLSGASFEEANLTAALLNNADLSGANLTGANLQGANLAKARLVDAVLEDADLTGAALRNADLTRVDLRSTALAGVCFENATMQETQLEGVRIAAPILKSARLLGAYLTGSVLPRADFRNCDLTGARLAEIDWEGADLRKANLRNATFHMGSSRSGLVWSPYACEGSKTGFYTDDFEDLNFKRPEEIRKANLCGADLRGVIAPDVDFYLVDLRGAKMDSELREQARASGAILDDSR